MKIIKLIISDVDGCLGDFEKPEYPEKQDLSNHFEDLEKLKEKIKENNVRFSVCTGRSSHLVNDMVNCLDIKEPYICEMGHIIVSEKNEQLVTNFDGLVDASEKLKDWMEVVKLENSNIKRLWDNKEILTYEFDLDCEEVFKELEGKMPLEIKELIKENKLKVVKSKNAIDVMVDLNKGDGVKHILNRLGIKKENVLGIGDNYHSDVSMMEECGFVACPGNSDEKLKEYVRSKNGYISEKECMKGVLDILEKFK